MTASGSTKLTREKSHHGVEWQRWRSQATVSLSSGSAETEACVRGLVGAVYVSNSMDEIGETVSCAGLGHFPLWRNETQTRHLEEANMWTQQVLRPTRTMLKNINGRANPDDEFANYLTRQDTTRRTFTLGFPLIVDHGQDEYFDEDFLEGEA